MTQLCRYCRRFSICEWKPERGGLPLFAMPSVFCIAGSIRPSLLVLFMKETNTKIRYFLYARKSSESEDRQVQSIDDQLNRLKRLAIDLNLNIKKIYTEAKSAKKPDNRPLFDEMIERIEAGEAEGILCWQINRLSRNPIDSGKLSWLLQRNILKSIQTIDRQYLPDDNVLLFNVESGSANQFILDLSKNTKRGVQSKLEKGELPGPAPLGYLNNKEDKVIISDPDRFSLVKKMWDLMLTGNCPPSKILDIANNEWGFRTRKTKRAGGKPLSMSGIYRIFKNKFYAGIIEHLDQSFKGSHEPLITLEEYDRVQVLLGGKDKAKPHTHQFAFTGFIRCGECGCLITAEEKRRVLKSGEEKLHTYYHCTHKKRELNCSQKGVPMEDLELQIEQELEKYTILPEFLQWALEALNKKNDSEIQTRSSIYETQHKAISQAQNELDELTRMRYRQLIDDGAFLKEKENLQKTIAQMQSRLRETESRAERWLELTEKTFTFATYARKEFLLGGLERKKEILKTLGKTATIIDGKLTIEANEWLQPIKDGYPALEKEYLRLEQKKTAINTARTVSFNTVHTRWLRGWESDPRPSD